MNRRGSSSVRRISSRRSAGDEAAAIAGRVLKLAVLLQAGASPDAAWRHLAGTGDADAERIARRAAAGTPLPDSIEAEAARPGGDPWRDVAAAWDIAATVGAPLADCLRSIAAALRDAREAQDDVRIALAEPAGTARLMTWLPLAGLLLGAALGFDVLGVLFTHPVGIACLLVGAGLLLLARGWTRRLVRTAQPPPGTPGMHAELTAIALSGGASIERAQRLVAEAPGGPRPGAEETAAVLALSRDAGVPGVELLRATAAHERQSARTEGRLRAAKLGARLLLPLGVCTLPAFLCLGVAPMLLGVLSATPLPELPG
ncbi:pilus assembly protein TadB [Microbacterium paludicola]|uniref:Pilus assembly protein TadB n=1 Tax=Microbacterium paludicola TaxID=300019 RepID=A0A4Y9G0U4_9MICO|nr:type II secretion system F family protein [Microbacterium paludicola]MBF0815009.1 type II secretion system F family protein [Microbacterium paludicola]TFU34290.1 pilus assembly protein TadB [Microbacterium paludicola]